MFTPDQLRGFFERYNIPLEGTIFIGSEEVTTLFIQGYRHGAAFAAFLLSAAFNTNKDSLQTNFNSWDDLYDAYSCFMTGYHQNRC